MKKKWHCLTSWVNMSEDELKGVLLCSTGNMVGSKQGEQLKLFKTLKEEKYRAVLNMLDCER